jgi:hypothetical protein
MTRNIELSEKTLEIEEKNRQKEALIKEMDMLIGPLYSRIDDKEIFNPRGTSLETLLQELGNRVSPDKIAL